MSINSPLIKEIHEDTAVQTDMDFIIASMNRNSIEIPTLSWSRFIFFVFFFLFLFLLLFFRYISENIVVVLAAVLLKSVGSIVCSMQGISLITISES